MRRIRWKETAVNLPIGRIELLRGLDLYLGINIHAFIYRLTVRSECSSCGVGGVWLIWGE